MSHGEEDGLKSAEKVSRIIWMAPYYIIETVNNLVVDNKQVLMDYLIFK